MSLTLRRPIVALLAHARDVPAADRVQFASRLHAELASGTFILETCHRVEAYAMDTDGPEIGRLRQVVPTGGRVLAGPDAVRHAVRVAAGRDSVVLGEDQILHQIRGSLEAVHRAGTLEPEIDRLFGLALQAGRRARSWRSGRQRSLADVALETVERADGPIRGHDVLVVGAGRMGELMARAAVAAGARVAVANRSIEHARAVAAATGSEIVPFDPSARVSRYTAIFVALRGPWTVRPTTAQAITERRPHIVDLSVPSAVDPTIADTLGDRMVTADDLAVITAAEARVGASSDPRTDDLVEHTVQRFLDWQARGDSRAAADALVRRADREREAELDVLWRKLPTLEPEARAAIEGMTRHLAARLLRQPLERLGRDPDGSDGRTVRDLFAL